MWSVDWFNVYFICEVSMKESCDGKVVCLLVVVLVFCMIINIKYYGKSLENGKKFYWRNVLVVYVMV